MRKKKTPPKQQGFSIEVRALQYGQHGGHNRTPREIFDFYPTPEGRKPGQTYKLPMWLVREDDHRSREYQWPVQKTSKNYQKPQKPDSNPKLPDNANPFKSSANDLI